MVQRSIIFLTNTKWLNLNFILPPSQNISKSGSKKLNVFGSKFGPNTFTFVYQCNFYLYFGTEGVLYNGKWYKDRMWDGGIFGIFCTQKYGRLNGFWAIERLTHIVQEWSWTVFYSTFLYLLLVLYSLVPTILIPQARPKKDKIYPFL
jgi:uncharacterized membrane protein YagU involved in acid resistance